jgi:O-acetyl-ADP-ribose deacetylase (regulator of RNase III)
MKHIKGDVLEVSKNSKSAVLLHQVNCQGVMGGGIAKQIKDKYPNHFIDYCCIIDHSTGQHKECLGQWFITFCEADTAIVGLFGQYCFGTDKRHTNYAAFVKSLSDFIQSLCMRKDSELIIPKNIGCGLGGGDWNIIEQILHDVEKMYGVEFTCVEFTCVEYE